MTVVKVMGGTGSGKTTFLRNMMKDYPQGSFFTADFGDLRRTDVERIVSMKIPIFVDEMKEEHLPSLLEVVEEFGMENHLVAVVLSEALEGPLKILTSDQSIDVSKYFP